MSAMEQPVGEWRDLAACRGQDPHLFVPDIVVNRGRPRKGVPKEVAVEIGQALAFCAICAVRADCLAFALEHAVDGVWGGTLPDQRVRMRSRSGLAQRGHPPRDADTTRRVVWLWKRDWKVAEIARDLNLGVHEVHRRLHDAGLDPIPPPTNPSGRPRRQRT